MAYKIEIINTDEKDRLINELGDRFTYGLKADINGVCIKLNTDVEDWKEEWQENWHPMPKSVHSHGRLFVTNLGGKEIVKYDPLSKTTFIFDTDYYGYVKSVALAVAGDLLEDNHNVFSVHGACLDIDGKGVSIVAPSGTGKTTTSYGLMRLPKVRLVSDDWHFLKFYGDSVVASNSEMNSYIRADIAEVWHEYDTIVKDARFDNRERAIVDVRRIVGKGNVRDSVTLAHVILLKRDNKDKNVVKKMEPKEALDYMIKTEYCNPHLLVHDARKKRIREQAYLDLFTYTDVYMVNTITTPEDSFNRVRKLLGIPESLKPRVLGEAGAIRRIKPSW